MADVTTVTASVNETLDIKLCYRYRYLRYESNIRYGGFLIEIYLKRNNNAVVFGSNATVSVSLDGNNSTVLSEEFLGIPFDGNYHKVGTAVFNYINMNTARTTTAQVKCTGGINEFNFTKNFTISVPQGVSKDNDFTASTFTTIKSDYVLGENIYLTLEKSDIAAIIGAQHIRYWWGNSQDQYGGFSYYSLGNWHNLQSDSDSTFVISNSTKNIRLIIPDTERNRLISKENDICIIELQTRKKDSLLTKTFFRVIRVSVPETYKPSITQHSESHFSENSTVSSWGVCLQNYSKVTANFTASHNDNIPMQYHVNVQGVGQTDNNSITTGVADISGTVPVTYTATDSRGRTVTLKVASGITILPYSNPVLKIKEMYRKASEQSTEVDTGGPWLFLFPSTSYSSCGGNNYVSVYVQWAEIPDGNYNTGQSITNNTGNSIDAELTRQKSYKIKVTAADGLGNASIVEKEITSFKILLHMNTGGQAMGIGMYNYQNNTLKVGYDFFLGENPIEQYIKNSLTDYIIGEGQTTSRCINASHNDDFLGTVNWYYYKWKSGKVELYGTLEQCTVYTQDSDKHYAYIYPVIPTDDSGEKLIKENGLVLLTGSADSLCQLGQGNASGINGSYLVYLLSQKNNFTSITVRMGFHAVYIP